MSQSRMRATRMFAAAAVLTAAACAPERSPTAPVLPDGASFAAGGNGNGSGGNAAKVKIKKVQLSSTTLTVDGSSVSATIDLGNTGTVYQSGVSIIAEVAQPAASREAANVLTKCSASAQLGFLPTGNCTMSVDVRASSAGSGAGTFVSGPAVLRVRVVHVANNTTTELATRNVDVNLVVTPPAGPSITTLTLENTTLTINGPSTTYTATLTNPGPALPNLTLQGYMVQGANEYTAGGTTVTCSGLPELPTGTCTVTFVTYASTDLGGPGPLVPGPAAFKLLLMQTVGGNVTLDTESVDVTLVAPSPPSLTSVTPAVSELMIGGRTESVSIAIANQGPQRSAVSVKGLIIQGFARVEAMNTSIACGGTPGTLPVGGCTTVASITVPAASGVFGLTPGSATLEVQLVQTDGTTETVLDTDNVSVTLVTPTPWISASTVPSSIPIGTDVQLAVIVRNMTTTQFPNSAVVVNVIQGGVPTQVASVPAGCGGTGVITSGDCVVGMTVNLGAPLIGGAAKVEVRLTTASGATLLDTKLYDVTLTAP